MVAYDLALDNYVSTKILAERSNILSKKRWGDRKDGKLLHNMDAMHYICPFIYPNRCDNEAFIMETVDLRDTKRYLEEKNAAGGNYKYNVFQVVITAVMKTLTLMPKMNRFIANRQLYLRNEITASFVVKKQFTESSEEGLAVIHVDPQDNIDSIHEKVREQVLINKSVEEGDKDQSTQAMDAFASLPRFVSRTALHFFCWLDRHGLIPQGLIETDPFYTSVVLSNLGSIGLHAGYHHLVNWGTNSIFIVVGEIGKKPYFDENGNVEMRDCVDLGLTIDERIVDGYYYSKAVKLLKELVEHPDLLETPMVEDPRRE